MLKEPTEEILERIVDAHWSGGKGDGITFRDIHQINSCNHVLSGTVIDTGIEYGFIIEMGDIVGTDIKEWGLAEDVGYYKPPKVNLKTFIPLDPFLETTDPFKYSNYLRMRESKEFKEMEQKYNYDAYFQPGGFVEEHYTKWANTRGLKCGYMSSITND